MEVIQEVNLILFLMKFKYFKTLLNKVKTYDKKATNPFLKGEYEQNPFKTIYEQTYIWITKENNEN